MSGTLSQDEATWNNSEVIGAYDPERIRQLKSEVAGDLYVSGSTTLVRALLADGLVDQFDLLMYPLTTGMGERLFPEGAAGATFDVADVRRFDNGVVYLAYRPKAA